jgi:arylformamidase
VAPGTMDLIDISLALHPAMLVWPHGRSPAAHRIVDAGDDGSPRNSEWTLDSHAGTHVDAPLHWLPGGASVDGIPLHACLGPCTVVTLDEDRAVRPADLLGSALSRGRRVLVRTPNSERRLGGSDFDASFAALSLDAARALVDARVALVGIDYLSVEAPDGGGEVHRVLLRAGVVVLEGVDLRGVEAGDYMLSALPLRLSGGEASPVRAVLWR